MSTHRPIARLIVLLPCLWSMACAGPDGLDVSGTWSGTWQYVTSGLTVTDGITATLSQSDDRATGTWQSESGASGQISFNTMGTTSGMLTINQALLGGGSCNATASFQGTITDTHIEITLGDIPPANVCQWGTNARWVLDKQ